MSSIFKKLVNDVEKKLKRNVLFLSTRNIQSRWIKANKTQKRPYSRTLTAVYSAVLDELLMPGVIIAQRTRVRLDGSSFTKVTVEKNEQHFLEERVASIQNAYKKLTTRDIEIDFQKEPTFYTLKKGEKK
jgi:small subunit ribosomal protein S7e